MLHCRLS